MSICKRKYGSGVRNCNLVDPKFWGETVERLVHCNRVDFRETLWLSKGVNI